MRLLLLIFACILFQAVVKKDWSIKNIKNCSQIGLKFIKEPLDPEVSGFLFRCDQFMDEFTGVIIGYVDPEGNEVLFNSTFNSRNVDILTEHGYRYACNHYDNDLHDERVAISKCFGTTSRALFSIFAFNEAFEIVTDVESAIIEEHNMKCYCKVDGRLNMRCEPYAS